MPLSCRAPQEPRHPHPPGLGPGRGLLKRPVRKHKTLADSPPPQNLATADYVPAFAGSKRGRASSEPRRRAQERDRTALPLFQAAASVGRVRARRLARLERKPHRLSNDAAQLRGGRVGCLSIPFCSTRRPVC